MIAVGRVVKIAAPMLDRSAKNCASGTKRPARMINSMSISSNDSMKSRLREHGGWSFKPHQP